MSRRERRRYLKIKVETEQSLNERAIMDAVWDAVLRLFGEYGASQANLTLIEYDTQKGCAVVRCSNKVLEMVRASVASITKIDEKPVAFHILRVSGTLKSLRQGR